MKGTETRRASHSIRRPNRHGGVPLVKGTETFLWVFPSTSIELPRRCPPREGD